nr:MAG TPA: hypothetical protein [Caudoviricetes sp.]
MSSADNRILVLSTLGASVGLPSLFFSVITNTFLLPFF